MRQLPLGMRWRDRASFESFHAAQNGIAVLTLQQVAAGARHGVFWVAGAAASGKSHLLQAVCAVAAPMRRVAYLPLRTLLANGPEVLTGWQETSCLCIDDVDAVIGDLAWERGLFNLYRELDEQGAALMFAAGRPPRALPFALPDLASRCAHALLLSLAPLGEQDMGRALQKHAALDLPEETAQYLLRRMPRDMVRLGSLLESLDVAALEAQRRLTIPFVREVLERANPDRSVLPGE
jgi:DnaA family protein